MNHSPTTIHHLDDDIQLDVDTYLHGRRAHRETRVVEYQLGKHTRSRTVTYITNAKIRISSTTIQENTQS